MYGCKFVMSGGNGMYRAQTSAEAVSAVPFICRRETFLTSVGTILWLSSLSGIVMALKDVFWILVGTGLSCFLFLTRGGTQALPSVLTNST